MSGPGTDWLYNAAGTLSPDQKQAQIESNAWELIKASGGALSWPEAIAQASGTETAVLTADQADPSQAGVLNALSLTPGANTNWLLWGVLAVAGVAAIAAVTK